MFLDDWMIESKQDIVRRWPQAKPADVPPFLDAGDYAWVRYDPYIEKYRCWYVHYGKAGLNNNEADSWRDAPFVSGLYYAESEDGYVFEPCAHGGPTDPRFPGTTNSIALPDRPGTPKVQMFRTVLIDEHETDDTKRYKAPVSDGFIFMSADGIEWTPHRDKKWIKPLDSDTLNNMLYNPITKCYQFFCRPGNLDRRIAVVESKDLTEFSERRVILQSDIYDPPLHQLYGMVVFWYEDMFVSLLWDNFIPNEEPAIQQNQHGRIKMGGVVDTSLAYSYDGLYWLRGPRKPLLPTAEMPDYGWAGHYASSIVVGLDDVIRIYSRANRTHHGDFKLQTEFFEKGESDAAMRVYTIRKDGFAYLEPVGNWGRVTTRCLIPKDGDLTINFKAELGSVMIQISDPAGDPFPGFGFDDFVPLTGDELRARPRWKSGKKLEELIGKDLRLEFKMNQARLYAYRWDCTLHYALKPQERI